MKLNYLKSIILGSTFLLALGSCSVATETVEFEAPSQTFEFEDIYEGGGNAATVESNMKELLASDETLSKDNIESAILKGFTVSKNDSLGLSEVRGIKISLMCDELDMIDVALKSGMSETGSTVELEILKDVDVSEYLAKDIVYVIMDTDYTVDKESIEKFEVGIKFGIEVEKK